MGFSEEPLVSIDYKGSTYGGVVDALYPVDGTMVKLLIWNDNESNYTHQLQLPVWWARTANNPLKDIALYPGQGYGAARRVLCPPRSFCLLQPLTFWRPGMLEPGCGKICCQPSRPRREKFSASRYFSSATHL